MKYKKTGNSYLIRLEKGEEIVEKLTEFCRKEGIKSGHFSGIGGLEHADISYYTFEDKQYHSKVFDKPPYELLSINGNVSVSKRELKIHVHVVIGDKDFGTFGGHLNNGTVLPTCEIVFYKFDENIERKMDQETGLPLLNI